MCDRANARSLAFTEPFALARVDARVSPVQYDDTFGGAVCARRRRDRAHLQLRPDGATIPAHLGNFRTFLFGDLLRRTLRLRGWKVRQVMNLTDVDDKIIRRAHEQGKTIREVTGADHARSFTTIASICASSTAEVYPKATDYIPQMIALVERLIERDVAYLADDKSVYFAIDRFPGYGRLSRPRHARGQDRARAWRRTTTPRRTRRTFALWKAAKPEDEASGAAWDSPWGRGRPGWHLECSAMAIDLLGRDARHSLRAGSI